MAEIDYQMALLLQHKFERELNREKLADNDYKLALALQEEGSSSGKKYTPSLTESDRQLALHLQEDFKREAEIESPANNLVYKQPKNVDNTKCLVDPSWEVIDPTPDIHVLFISFNERFFWGTLGSVTVSWSKKMTSCAGICSYQGRGGLCSITLSEPLLKLRPRKDLVETLLHEMIHAYLFVTDNNRDRDGHGPEFHKHMYRINAEAGTSISVYHDFHDEVKLYQQHWWRCDGPCQQRKPYFGVVRRAVNRPPGPSDRWWGDHERTCGGSFIKVQEPEKATTKKPAKNYTKTKSDNDIRNYIPVQNKIPASFSNSNKENQAVTNNGTSSNANIAKNNTKPETKIQGISNNNSNSKISNIIPSKTSNIHGFTNLSTPSSAGSSTNANKKAGFGISGATKNSGGNTVVVNKKPSTVVRKNDDSKPKPSVSTEVQTYKGVGRKLSDSGNASVSDYSVVRNRWLNKFKNKEDTAKSNVKRTNSTEELPQKMPKLDSFEENECPICGKRVLSNELNVHLDDCLDSQEKVTKECIICCEHVKVAEFELHVLKCCDENFKDTDDVFESQKVCPKCDEKINEGQYDTHVKHCGDTVDLSDCDDVDKNCPVCKLALKASEYDVHTEECLMKVFDDLEQKYDLKTDRKTSCLACGKEIMKSELDDHLEDCMNMTTVFDTSNEVIEEEKDNISDVKSNCPICLVLVLKGDMQTHLDACLSKIN